ncbi:GumC family protein [Anabaenopsis elenkinii]|nr:polysaccharide biosynthesis tyrosine autokinase [Anabaenopsis elenkinii]
MRNTNMNQNQLVHYSSIKPVNLRRLPEILLHRRFFSLGISCLFMSVAGFLALNIKPNYQSSMQILVNSNLYTGARVKNIPLSANNESTDSLGGVTTPDSPVFEHNSQIKMMMSSKLLQKAVDILRSDYPHITLEDIKGNSKNNKKTPLVVNQLQGISGVYQSPSQIFEVSFNDPDPVKTQRVLQALQKVYQEYNQQQQQERLQQGLSFVSARLPQTKQHLSQAEKNLEDFRHQHHLVDPEVESKILLASLADVQKQQQITRAQIKDLQARYNNLEQKIAELSQDAKIASRLQESTGYQSLLGAVENTQLAIARETMRYTEESPILEQLRQQYQSQKALLEQERKKLLDIKDVQNVSDTRKLAFIQGQNAEVNSTLVQEFIQVQTVLQGLTAQSNSLSESEKQLKSQLSKYPSLIAEYNRLLTAVETQSRILEQLLQTQQFLGLKISQGGFDWQILEEPALGSSTSDPRAILLLGGIVVSPIAGIALSVIWSISDHTIYSVNQLQKLTQLRLLGSVPKLPFSGVKKPFVRWFWRQQENFPPLLQTNTCLPGHKSFDILYQNLQIFQHSQPCQSLMLTSAISREGKTTLALGLAASAARMHRRVLLIDANLDSPHLHKNFHLSNEWGLSVLLIDDTNTQVQDYIQPIHPSIDILTAGPTPEDTMQALTQERMRQLLKLFEQTYDLVLIDAPPILGTVDSRILASCSQAIVMVSRIGQVTANQLTQAIEVLSQLNLLGIVANYGSNSHG